MILVLAAVNAAQAVGYTYTSLVDYPGGSGMMHPFGWL